MITYDEAVESALKLGLYIAMDKSGDCYLYKDKPFIEDFGFDGEHVIKKVECVESFKGYWKESLRGPND